MTIENKSYLFGLLTSDGNLYLQSRNRGKISFELKTSDEELLYKIQKVVENGTLSSRTRDTNFKKSYTSSVYSNSMQEFRQIFIDMGLPLKNKAETCGLPKTEYSQRDFWRGVLDGDGSIGIIADGSPFISLVTKSEDLKNAYCDLLLKKLGLRKSLNRNKRDNVYNIIIKNEYAVELAKYLYSENDELFLERKFKKSMEMQEWKRLRPKRTPQRRWTKEEEEIILNSSIEEAMQKTGRTFKSIKSQKARLKAATKNILYK